jgi:hypothetical protein
MVMKREDDYDDEYLWDRSGTPDPDVERLERLLGPLALDPRSTPPELASEARVSWRWIPLAAAALLTMAYGLRQLVVSDGATEELRLVVAETGRDLRPDAVFVAREGESSLELGDVGQLSLRPGSRLRVGTLDTEAVVLELEHGLLDALVSADAKPGFFNVDTPAARCVDLGCAYTLTVDEETGDALVEVRLGRVAFRDGRREVFVPEGAACAATRATGAGTPLYVKGTSPALALAALEYDAARGAAPDVRLRAAEALVAAAEGAGAEAGELPVWHLLQDDEPAVVELALRQLRRSSRTDGATVRRQPGSADFAAWREYLWPDPYRWSEPRKSPPGR